MVEIDPDLKLKLYTALTSEGRTLKDWFVDEARHFVEGHEQPSLFARGSASGRGPERREESS